MQERPHEKNYRFGVRDSDEAGFSDRMNSIPKYVVSTTLKEPAWNNSRLIKTNVVNEVPGLKQQPGQDILIAGSGSGRLVSTLMQHDLIDEYRFLVYHVVLGVGKRLFENAGKKTRRLLEIRTFGSGVVLLRYQPDRKE